MRHLSYLAWLFYKLSLSQVKRKDEGLMPIARGILPKAQCRRSCALLTSAHAWLVNALFPSICKDKNLALGPGVVE